MGTLHPALTTEIAKYRAKRQKEMEERRRSAISSTRRNWRFRADATLTIEIPPWAKEATDETSIAKETEVGPDLSLAPGCFGLAMTFKPDAKECVPCPFHQRCKPLAAQNLTALSAERANDPEFHKEFAEYQADKRARNRKAKAKSRTKLKVLTPSKHHPVASVALTFETLAHRKAKLIEWLAHDEPRQQQHRKHQKEILLDYAVFQNEHRRIKTQPGPTAFARALTNQTGRPVSTSSAQKRLARLCRLESAGGPWFDPERVLLA